MYSNPPSVWLDLQPHCSFDLRSVLGVHDARKELHRAADWEAEGYLSVRISIVGVKPGCSGAAVRSELSHTSEHTGPAVDVFAHDCEIVLVDDGEAGGID